MFWLHFLGWDKTELTTVDTAIDDLKVQSEVFAQTVIDSTYHHCSAESNDDA
jgi:hypothetical protein